MENQPLFNQKAFCGLLLQSNSKTACPYSDERYEWTIDIPRKAEIAAKDFPVNADSNESFKIAHLTDIHYDPIYEPGGLAACNDPTCCRKGQTERASRHWKSLEDDSEEEQKVHLDEDGNMFIDLDQGRSKKSTQRTPREKKNETKDEPAGYWGDYRHCDLPWWSFVDGVERVAEHKDVDMIYYTGDTIDHGVWDTSKPLITDSLNETLNKFKEVFGNRPVFPGIGNHESQPLNQYAPPSVTDPEVSTSWLYELLFDKWSFWLPSETKQTILTGGYYTTLAKPGLRVIVLNSNVCYKYNWWIHLDPNDPSGQLKWLTSTLLNAEKAGERVHILSHIPPGVEDQYYTCAREYVKIIRRFSNIIVAELNGHTHNDEFKIYYNSNMQNPLLVAWNSGSLTPFSFVNPNYRIFKVDGKTFDLLDFDTYIYNLTEANLTPDKQPRWFKSYSFKEHYGVKSLAASDIDNLVHRMITTDKKLLTHDYHIFRGKSSDSYVNQECDNDCIKENICYMVDMDLYDTSKCDYLWRKFNETNPH